VTSFSDLGPGLVAEHRDPTPVDAEQVDADFGAGHRRRLGAGVDAENVEDPDDEALSDPRG
jgi:hypothetical protein